MLTVMHGPIRETFDTAVRLTQARLYRVGQPGKPRLDSLGNPFDA
jgi:hypothetical protein